MKILFSFRIEKALLEEFMLIAERKGTTATKLLNDKITDVVYNNYPFELKIIVKKICDELRQPFAYVKPLRSKAVKERANKEEIAKKLETIFHL